MLIGRGGLFASSVTIVEPAQELVRLVRDDLSGFSEDGRGPLQLRSGKKNLQLPRPGQADLR